MGIVEFKVNYSAIRKAVKQNVVGPIVALSKNPKIAYKIADRAIGLVNKYVPMKTGNLRRSAHVVQHSRTAKIVYGDPEIGKTKKYADIQYYRDLNHPEWEYTTPGTRGQWMDVLQPGTNEYKTWIKYASKIMKAEVKK